jgi:hypothetical protein
MSVENVPAVVNIKTLNLLGTLYCTQATGWTVGVVKSGKEEECCGPVTRFAVKYKSETNYWTQKLNGEDYGVDKYLLLL